MDVSFVIVRMSGFARRTNFKFFRMSILKARKVTLQLLLVCVSFLATGCGGGGSGVASAPTPVIEPSKFPLGELRILVIGQSISSNCNEHRYGPVENVLQVARDGSIKPASDPFEWADCGNGSTWMPLGKKLIENGIARKVLFMPIGVGGTKVRDWQEGGLAFSKLNSAIATIKQQGISFDFAFWHQGSADIGSDKNDYLSRLASVVSYVNSNVQVSSWLIALHSRCNGFYDRDIEEVQRAFGNAPASHRYVGANNNLLGEEYRIDGCHLKQNGQEEMAAMWFESIKNALEIK